MTKYILNSGGIKHQPELKKQFHQEMVKGLANKLQILIVLFPQPREYWEQKYSLSCESIKSDIRDHDMQFELAFPDIFEAQVKRADIIYMSGGDDALCRYWFSNYNLSELFTDKIVVTNSATSEMLSASFWTCDWRQCSNGFGILPIKFMPHFHSDFGKDDPRGPIDWPAAQRELAEYGDQNLPVYTLEEGRYEVFKV